MGARELISRVNLRSEGCELAALIGAALRSVLAWPGDQPCLLNSLEITNTCTHGEI